MINLIPPHARKQVKIEYWARAVSMWVLLTGLALLIVAILMVPSFVLIKSQQSAYKDSYAEASAIDASYKELEASVREANSAAARLVKSPNSYSFTDILDELELITGRPIRLTSVSAARDEEGMISSIEIGGVAATRIDLVAYRNAIEAHAFFVSAYIPISGLAKDKDVPFSLSIEVNQPEAI